MALGNAIILTGEPKGRFFEGIISGTPKPGTIMQIDVSEGLGTDGRATWEAYNADADGNRRMLAVLLEDDLRGRDELTAYADGDRGRLYVPLPGDELNLLFNNVAGTADDVVFGDLLIVDDGTGKLNVTTGSPESEPFQAMEAYTDPTADQLIHVLCTGY